MPGPRRPHPDLPSAAGDVSLVATTSVDERDGAVVRDVTIPAGEATRASLPEPGTPIEAYLVGPPVPPAAPGPGLLFAHWYDTHAPNGNRSEFLDEALDWARRRQATSILPQLTFPWHGDPDGSAADVARIGVEVARLRRCLDVLLARPSVDPDRVAVVGHDFGAMHATLLGSMDRRPAAYVLIAAVPRWGDWFLPFWRIDEDRIDYLRALRPLDPIEHVGRLGPARLLFQFAKRDFYIAPMAGFEFRRTAGEGAEVRSYDAEHDMASPEALAERTAFLEDALALE